MKCEMMNFCVVKRDLNAYIAVIAGDFCPGNKRLFEAAAEQKTERVVTRSEVVGEDEQCFGSM
jgi:hypothetical protein